MISSLQVWPSLPPCSFVITHFILLLLPSPFCLSPLFPFSLSSLPSYSLLSLSLSLLSLLLCLLPFLVQVYNLSMLIQETDLQHLHVRDFILSRSDLCSVSLTTISSFSCVIAVHRLWETCYGAKLRRQTIPGTFVYMYYTVKYILVEIQQPSLISFLHYIYIYITFYIALRLLGRLYKISWQGGYSLVRSAAQE